MLTARLIQLIQDHADSLTRDVIKDITTNPHTTHWHHVPTAQLEKRIYQTYRNLGAWIGDPKEDAIRAEYGEWGARRYQGGVPLSEVMYAVILLKHHLRRYIREHGLVEYSKGRETPPEFLPVHLYGIQELNYQVGDFFDKALYYLAQGYEAAAREGQPPAPR